MAKRFREIDVDRIPEERNEKKIKKLRKEFPKTKKNEKRQIDRENIVVLEDLFEADGDYDD